MDLLVVCWNHLDRLGSKGKAAGSVCSVWGAGEQMENLQLIGIFIFLTLFSFQWCPDREQIFP